MHFLYTLVQSRVIAAIVLGALIASDPDRAYFGRWKLNVVRSTFNGVAPPRESTRIIDDRRFGLISTVTDTVDLNGHVEHSAYVSRLDGRAYLMSPPGADPKVTITETAVDSFVSRFVIESEGFVIADGTRTVSGGEMIIETHLPDAYGVAMTSVMVWEKVEEPLKAGPGGFIMPHSISIQQRRRAAR